tara:strand:- start:31544 stop:31963 length:420 start_codon:yes stop_codon:yes gene_type:complete
VLLLLAYLPVAACAANDAQQHDCAEAISTLAINQCAQAQVRQAEGQMEVYLAAASERYAEDPEALTALQTAQQSWVSFRQEHCAAVYTLWREGSIRGLMHNQCMLQQTRQRSHDIWQVYLTYMDGSPSLLPDPLVEVAE